MRLTFNQRQVYVFIILLILVKDCYFCISWGTTIIINLFIIRTFFFRIHYQAYSAERHYFECSRNWRYARANVVNVMYSALQYSIVQRLFVLHFTDLVVGGVQVRQFWKHYFNDCQAIIFVVNSAASDDELNTAKGALENVLQSPQLAGLPCLVLGNRQDVAQARHTEQVLWSIIST
jgi:hypothetical protein